MFFLMIILDMFESDTQIKLLIIPHQLTHLLHKHAHSSTNSQLLNMQTCPY